MRILILVQKFYPHIGGIESHIMSLVRQLKNNGHECFIMTAITDVAVLAEEDWEGVKIRRFAFEETMNRANLSAISALFKAIQHCLDEFKPDVLHMNGDMRHIILYRFFLKKWLNQHKILITLHGILNYEFNNDLDKYLNSISWLNCVSNFLLQEFIGYHPSIKHKVSYIHNAIPLLPLQPSPLSFNPARILCLGRLTSEKGFDQAIVAFYLVSKKFPHAELIIAGEGFEYCYLNGLVRTLGLTEKVKFTAKIDPADVPALINTATMLLAPSRYESFGIAAIEAAFMGRPVIAANVGGLKEVFTHLETGMLAESENIDAFAACIEYLLNNQEEAIAIGQRAREMVIEKYNTAKMAEQYEALYQKIAC